MYFSSIRHGCFLRITITIIFLNHIIHSFPLITNSSPYTPQTLLPWKPLLLPNIHQKYTIHSHTPKQTNLDYQFENKSDNRLAYLNGRKSKTTSRRHILQTFIHHGFPILAALSEQIIQPISAFAQEDLETSMTDQTKKTFVRGTISLPQGIQFASSSSSDTAAALYVTARPDKLDNIPRAILDGSRGKAPPVLIARFPLSKSTTTTTTTTTTTYGDFFPYSFALTENDLTMEGQSQWFVSTKEDLIISVRLDMDGVAATRDPDDLVGRAIYYGGNGNVVRGGDDISIQLQSRGITGKFVTKKSK